MTEPTLGQRIMDAAEAYANAVQEAIQTWGAGEWTGHHDEATAEELATLRALAARADAAERLAVAAVFRDEAMADESETHRPGYRSDIPNVVFTVRLLAAKEAYSEALAAWRAITEEVE